MLDGAADDGAADDGVADGGVASAGIGVPVLPSGSGVPELPVGSGVPELPSGSGVPELPVGMGVAVGAGVVVGVVLSADAPSAAGGSSTAVPPVLIGGETYNGTAGIGAPTQTSRSVPPAL